MSLLSPLKLKMDAYFDFFSTCFILDMLLKTIFKNYKNILKYNLYCLQAILDENDALFLQLSNHILLLELITKICDWQMAVLRPFLANFPLSFTKLSFRWSIWGAERVWTSIGSKVMTQNENGAFTNRRENTQFFSEGSLVKLHANIYYC